jgi:hypothetical protein
MSIDRSIYEKVFLESNDRSRVVDIKSGVVAIDYYEDIFSPTITAKVYVINAGNTIAPEDGTAAQSIYNGLPLRGGERVSLKIAGNSTTNNGLDFSSANNSLYVSSITDVISESQREIFTLNLVSREAITNETSRVGKKFKVDSKINTSVTDILNKYLKTTKIGKIDDTKNGYGFIGNLKKPFTVLVWLASKAISPETDTAGFVFYQTVDGFQFRAIDQLIMQPFKAEYTYTEVNQSSIERDNTFNILNYKTEKNQNLIEKLRLGAYSTYRIFYNPLTYQFTNPNKSVYKQQDWVNKSKNLGKTVTLPKISEGSNQGLGDIPTRIITQCLDIGTLDPDISKSVNADPTEYQSQALMRYNVLLTQTITMTVPLNTNLRAGDVISCRIPKISTERADEFDEEQSGLYMIKELCHHFDTERSLTSMKLVRDTFGYYGTNTK